MDNQQNELLNANAAETIVGSSVSIEGDFKSEGNVRIDGEVSGSVATKKDLAVGENAKIKANVKAENIVIAGRIEGNVEVKNQLELTETGEVQGDIKTKVISIKPGAVFNGQCSMEQLKEEDKEEEKAEKIEEGEIEE